MEVILMTVSKRFYQVAIVFCAVMALMFCLMVPAHATEADPSTNNYYLQVDQNLLGQITTNSNYGVIYGPYKVSAAQIQTATNVAPADQTVLDLLKTVCGNKTGGASYGVSYTTTTYGTYVTAFSKANLATPASGAITANLYESKGYITSAQVGELFNSNMYATDTNTTQLSPTEYSGVSGWMFTQNDSNLISGNYLSVDNKLVNYGDEAVIHFDYSIDGGSDVGISDSYIPTATTTNDDGKEVYDWNSATNFVSIGSMDTNAASIRTNATTFTTN